MTGPPWHDMPGTGNRWHPMCKVLLHTRTPICQGWARDYLDSFVAWLFALLGFGFCSPTLPHVLGRRFPQRRIKVFAFLPRPPPSSGFRFPKSGFRSPASGFRDSEKCGHRNSGESETRLSGSRWRAGGKAKNLDYPACPVKSVSYLTGVNPV